jgi:hypothetical protein
VNSISKDLLKKKLEVMSKYTQMSRLNKEDEESGVYKYCIAPGNNSVLVKRVLQNRGKHWKKQEIDHLTLFDFKWAPVMKQLNFELIGVHGQKKVVNHLERHDLLSTKDMLFRSMYRQCEAKKEDVFKYLPI